MADQEPTREGVGSGEITDGKVFAAQEEAAGTENVQAEDAAGIAELPATPGIA